MLDVVFCSMRKVVMWRLYFIGCNDYVFRCENECE